MADTIEITVILKGYLRHVVKLKAPATLSMPAGSVAGDILQQFSLPAHMVGVYVINGKSAPKDQPLCDGDDVAIFSMVVGG